MSISTDLEEDVDSAITEFGESVTIQKQTSTSNTYDETDSWTNSGSATSATTIIMPLNATSELEWRLTEQGILQPGDKVCYLKATETIEESVTGTGTSAQTRTRYVITYDSLSYVVVHLQKWPLQSNQVYYKLYIRKNTI